MTFLTKTALAALMTGALGLPMLPATALAQATTAPQSAQGQKQDQGRHFRQGGQNLHFRLQVPKARMMRAAARGHGGLLTLVCSPNGAEQLEISLVRMAHRLTLTPEQQPLFDDLRTTALTAQTNFADTCAAARPAKAASTPAAPSTAPAAPSAPVAATATRPTLVEALKTRIALDTARIEALNTVLPKLETLYAALTDTQKGAIETRQRGDRWQKGQARPAPAPVPAPAQPAPADAPATTGG